MESFGEEQFRAYFLGKLSAAESEVFEEDCAASEELTEQAQAFERELIDDYLRGNLSEPDARLFEENYPLTELRQNRLRAARELWKIAARKTSSGKPPAQGATSFFRQKIFGAPYGFQFALGGLLVLLLIFGALAFYLLTLDAGKSELADVKVIDPLEIAEQPRVRSPEDSIIQSPEAETQNPPPDEENPVIQNKESDKTLTPPSKKTTGTKTPPDQKSVRQNQPGYAAFLLFSGAVRGEAEQSITIAPNVKKVNLLLNPSGEPNGFKNCRAVLKTAEGDTVFTAPDLNALSFSVSADRLESRTYVIYLEGQNASGEFESISEYIFRVRR